MNKEIEEARVRFLRRKIVSWGKTNFADFPWRHTKNKWHALAAEIMLQRTQANQVVPVYNSFCKTFPSPVKFAKEPSAKIFSSLGLAWRESQFKELAGRLSGKEIPSDKKALLKLPGIGEYIASAYRSLHLDLRDSIIDSNVVRIYGRFFGFETNGETRRKKWLAELADELTPKRNFRFFNYGLIDFTRAICKPRPLCRTCLLKRKCENYSGSDHG